MTTAKERADQMKLVARLSQARCAKCKHDKTAECGCEASARLKEINENWKGSKNVVKAEVGGVCFKDGVIAVEKYKQAKEQGMSDATIQNQLGWHGMKMNRWKRDHGLLGKSVYEGVEPIKIVSKEEVVNPVPQIPLVPKTEYDELQTKYGHLCMKYSELEKDTAKIVERLHDELETAEHYVKQTQKLNEALQGQVDRLAKELEETKKSQSGNWRELEQQVKADKLEYEKLAKDFDELDQSNQKEKRRNVLLVAENDRVNELNTMLMLNTLKIVERAGDIA